MSTNLQIITDAMPFGPVDEIDDKVWPLYQAVSGFLELSLMEKISEVIAYHDENGLPPTNDALTVIARVLAAIDEVDEAYDTPMYCRYTENVRVMLRTGGKS